MNRIDKKIAKRIQSNKRYPIAFCGWSEIDLNEVILTITTKGYDYTRKSGCVIFECGE